MKIDGQFLDPPEEFTVMPFWFWNDSLDTEGIVRKIKDFYNHGVYGFIIHPRVGLPKSLGWMSDGLLHFYDIAIKEAHDLNMRVLLYDEGMYPSGSSHGQVVLANPDYQCRCLAKIDILPKHELPDISENENIVAIVKRNDGRRIAVVDRKLDSCMRGLHYIDESKGPEETRPLSADLLNGKAVDTFIELVYKKFAERFAAYIPNTFFGMFTDEPGMLGKYRQEKDVFSGTSGILEHVNRILGYDFTPHLASLWYDDEPHAEEFRNDYLYACECRLGETYYAKLSDFCMHNQLSLCGHPAQSNDIGKMRYFHIPGQDAVWRKILPDMASAIEGVDSTQAKCSSSAMFHLGRRRNSNEFCGAYGHEFTWEEMKWLTNWLLARGVNMLIPHAFYYSIRGLRHDERPPDVGPNSDWWGKYKPYADFCRRLCWLNTDSRHVCHVAIVCKSNSLPWKSAKICFENQIDFNYLEERHLWEDATVDESGISIRGMKYAVAILEGKEDAKSQPYLKQLEANGRLFRFENGNHNPMAENIKKLIPKYIEFAEYNPSLRVRHIVKNKIDYFMLFNETSSFCKVKYKLVNCMESMNCDPWSLDPTSIYYGNELEMPGHALKIIMSSVKECNYLSNSVFHE